MLFTGQLYFLSKTKAQKNTNNLCVNTLRVLMHMKFDKLTLNFIWKSKGSRITNILLKKRKKVEALVLN